MLVNTVAYGGNLIMNVGPTSRGYLDDRACDALSEYAKWMRVCSRSIYGCTMAEPEFTAPYGTRLTQTEGGKRLYIHLQEYPFGAFKFANLAGKIEYAQFLSDGSEVLYSEGEDGFVKFNLPAVAPRTISPVIEVFLKD